MKCKMPARGSVLCRAMVVGMAMAAPGLVGAAEAAPLTPVPAAASTIATQAMLLGAAWAGPRAVAVGDHGVVVWSDDGGATFRQARRVPVSSTLTAVSFSGARYGWAVGQWGAILATEDGGDTWQVQRLVVDEDRPLFAVHFFDDRNGVAVGLWSLVLCTDDGGRTWQEQRLPAPPGARKADLNLLGLFADRGGALYATAEHGQVLRSTDRGHSWDYLDTGYRGSLWTGAALPDGALLVGGQRGMLMRSDDGGRQWRQVALDTKSSITSIAATGQEVVAVGLDGLRAISTDGGRRFDVKVQAGGEAMTAVLASKARWIVLSRHGVVQQVK